jgi:hypothetical protein
MLNMMYISERYSPLLPADLKHVKRHQYFAAILAKHFIRIIFFCT